MWAYMPYGPFETAARHGAWVKAAAQAEDPAFYAIAGFGGWSGVASLLRIARSDGVVELGHIALSPSLRRRTAAATEALHLLIDHAFAAGFRRMEWKCDARNAASRNAAKRLGYRYEGTFRQHRVVKGRNRDTAWFAILDGEWPEIRARHLAWLDPANFDSAGLQRERLSRSESGHRR